MQMYNVTLRLMKEEQKKYDIRPTKKIFKTFLLKGRDLKQKYASQWREVLTQGKRNEIGSNSQTLAAAGKIFNSALADAGISKWLLFRGCGKNTNFSWKSHPQFVQILDQIYRCNYEIWDFDRSRSPMLRVKKPRSGSRILDYARYFKWIILQLICRSWGNGRNSNLRGLYDINWEKSAQWRRIKKTWRREAIRQALAICNSESFLKRLRRMILLRIKALFSQGQEAASTKDQDDSPGIDATNAVLRILGEALRELNAIEPDLYQKHDCLWKQKIAGFKV